MSSHIVYAKILILDGENSKNVQMTFEAIAQNMYTLANRNLHIPPENHLMQVVRKPTSVQHSASNNKLSFATMRIHLRNSQATFSLLWGPH